MGDDKELFLQLHEIESMDDDLRDELDEAFDGFGMSDAVMFVRADTGEWIAQVRHDRGAFTEGMYYLPDRTAQRTINDLHARYS